jgi:hypothetical protein
LAPVASGFAAAGCNGRFAVEVDHCSRLKKGDQDVQVP